MKLCLFFSSTIVSFLLLTNLTAAVELTFEIPHSGRQCFYEDIKQNTPITFEFQVIAGGQYDIHASLIGPDKQIFYDGKKKQYDTVSVDQVPNSGVYSFCFDNDFSPFSNKLVYMSLNIGHQGTHRHDKAMTLIETSVDRIGEALDSIEEYQRHHRVRENLGRNSAENLNWRVLVWSLGETISILIVFFGQVVMIKDLFVDREDVPFPVRLY